jgi:hypothetical protein
MQAGSTKEKTLCEDNGFDPKLNAYENRSKLQAASASFQEVGHAGK